jgi:hypothetical protein
LDAVLPIVAADCERARSILLPSLERCYADLGTLWVICPAGDAPAVRAALRAPRLEVIDEEALVPELAAQRRLGFPRVSGWFKQQVLKLAAAELVRSEFFLTLDADVFAVSPWCDRDVLRGGRALRQRDKLEYYPEWLAWAARVLQCPPLDYQPGLTPVILSREVLKLLAAWVERHVTPGSKRWRVARLAGVLGARWRLTSWRGRLLASLPWTEYALYDTFLEREGLFDRFHFLPDDTLLLGNGVWRAEAFDTWRPRTRDAEGRRLLFNLVQSRANIEPARVEARCSAVEQ